MSSGDCPGTTLHTAAGLNFTVYCGLDATNIGDISNTGVDSLDDCLDRCARHVGTPCGAAAFDGNTQRCFFKNATVTASDASARDGWTLGIADPAQLQPLSTGCGGAGGRQEMAENGLNFTVYCYQDVPNLDLCGDGEPCRSHADSLGECMEHCSTLRPLCNGVSWTPTMFNGYLNCFPKNGTARDFDDKRVDASYSVFSAKALLNVADDAADVCTGRSNGTIVAQNGEAFGLSCNQDHPEDTLSTTNAPSLKDCVDACADYPDSGCAGAVFEPTMANGFENCYLKNGTSGPFPEREGFTFAVRQATSGAGNGTSGNGDATPSSDSKAWIAGPVIGALAAIILVLGALWWRRRRRRDRQLSRTVNGSDGPGHAYEHEPWLRQEMETSPPATKMPSHRYELGSDPAVQELDGTQPISREK